MILIIITSGCDVTLIFISDEYYDHLQKGMILIVKSWGNILQSMFKIVWYGCIRCTDIDQCVWLLKIALDNTPNIRGVCLGGCWGGGGGRGGVFGYVLNDL